MAKLFDLLKNATSIAVHGNAVEKFPYKEINADGDLVEVESNIVRLRNPIYADAAETYMHFLDQDVEEGEDGVIIAQCTMLPTGDVLVPVDLTIA